MRLCIVQRLVNRVVQLVQYIARHVVPVHEFVNLRQIRVRREQIEVQIHIWHLFFKSGRGQSAYVPLIAFNLLADELFIVIQPLITRRTEQFQRNKLVARF